MFLLLFLFPLLCLSYQDRSGLCDVSDFFSISACESRDKSRLIFTPVTPFSTLLGETTYCSSSIQLSLTPSTIYGLAGLIINAKDSSGSRVGTYFHSLTPGRETQTYYACPNSLTHKQWPAALTSTLSFSWIPPFTHSGDNITIDGIVLLSQPPSSFPDGGQVAKRDNHYFYRLAPIELSYHCPTPAPPTPEPPGLADPLYTCADAAASPTEYTCGDSIIGTSVDGPDATAEVNGATCGLDPGYSTWHRIRTGPDTRSLTVSNCNDFTQFDTRLHLYDGCGGACVAANDDSCGAYWAATLTTAVTPNTTYYVLQSGYQAQTGPYQIDLICSGPTPSPTPAPTYAVPSNDECAGAIPISCNESIVSSTAGSTSDYSSAPLANCYEGSGNGVWYNLTVPDDGVPRTVYLSNCGEATDFDTQLHVASAASCDDAEPVCMGYNDDDGDDDCPSLRSRMAFHTEPGASYLVVQSGSGSHTGTFQLDVTCETSTPAPTPQPPPEHEECDAAVPVACGDVISGELSTAKPFPGNCLSADGGAVWYQFESTHKAVVTVSSCGPGNELRNVLTVHDECGGRCLAKNVDWCGNRAEVAFLATEYQPYYLMMAGYFDSDKGPYNLTVSCEAVPTEAPTPVPTAPPTVKPTMAPTLAPTIPPPTALTTTATTTASVTSTTADADATTTEDLSSGTSTTAAATSTDDSLLSSNLGTADSTDSGLMIGGLIATVLVVIVCCIAGLALAHRRRREVRGERTSPDAYFADDSETDGLTSGTRSRSRSHNHVRHSTRLISSPGYTTVPMPDTSNESLPSGGTLKPIAASPEQAKATTDELVVDPVDGEAAARKSKRGSVRRSRIVPKGTPIE